MMQIKEIYNGLYKVSSDGKIITDNWKNSGRTSILRPSTDKKGYLRVGLQINGKLKTFKVHRLVALAFIPNPENKPQINHKDCNKKNNNVYNLEWCTAKENTKHAIENGLHYFNTPEQSINKIIKRGELNGCSKLNAKQVKEIRAKFKPRIYTRKILAKEYNVKEATIKDIVLRKSWKHI